MLFMVLGSVKEVVLAWMGCREQKQNMRSKITIYKSLAFSFDSFTNNNK